MRKKSKKPLRRKIVLRLPDLDHAKTAVFSSLSFPSSRRNYKFAMSNTVHELIAEGRMRVKVLPGADSWFGITYREDHSRAIQTIHHMIEAGYYPRRL